MFPNPTEARGWLDSHAGEGPNLIRGLGLGDLGYGLVGFRV